MTPVTNERGIALLAVLGLMSLLLVLASLAAGSSRMEAALSGVGKEAARTFAAAEAGLAYGLGDVDNFVSTNSLNLTCVTPTAACSTPPCFRTTDLTTAGVFTSPKTTGDVRVCFDRAGPPPTSIRVSALRFQAFFFDLDARGNKVTANAPALLQMEAARLGPR